MSRRFNASIGTKPLEGDTPLISSRIIDSFGVLELIAHLERSFAVEVDPARHDLSDFDTIDKIADLVVRLGKDRTVR